MKKLLSIVLSLVLLMGVWQPVLAEGEEIVVDAPTQTEAPSLEVVVEASSTPVTEATTTEPQEDVLLPLVNETDVEPPPVDPRGDIIVKFRDSKIDLDTSRGLTAAEEIVEGEEANVVDHIEDTNVAVVSSGEASTADTIEALEANPAVEFAEPNYLRRSFTIDTDDTFRGELWALENTGQTVNGVTGTSDDDIDGKEAWDISTGTSSLVAVIDTGVQYGHGDLAANMWDGSSCVVAGTTTIGGCIHGYDFATTTDDYDPLPIPFLSGDTHGTHVAGIIAAGMNNATGTIGVAPSARIMALRFDFYISSEINAIMFAKANGAKIINASYGGSVFSQSEHDAIEDFTNNGGLFIAAAGNSHVDGDVTPNYPASYNIDGIISVAATDQNDALASFSNYGLTSVDLGAPGVNILSTVTTNGSDAAHAFLNGTSMAAPHVAGVAALIWSKFPSLTAAEVKEAILQGGDARASLSGKSVSGKRLNAYGALRYAEDHTPPVITLTGSSTISLTIGDTYTEEGAIAYDAFDAATTTASVGGDTVDTSIAATYTVLYSATDTHGNAASTTRNVIVSDPVSSGGSSHSRRGGGGGGGGKKRSSLPTVNTTSSSAPIQNARFSRVIAFGESSPEVSALQAALSSAGSYTGPSTGYFGPQTEGAVRAFQGSHGLPVTGIVDTATQNALNQLSTPPALSASEIAEIQSQIQAIIALILQIQARMGR